MPFRIPRDYVGLPCWGADPTADDVRVYLAWLDRERAVAAAVLEQLTRPKAPPPADPKGAVELTCPAKLVEGVCP